MKIGCFALIEPFTTLEHQFFRIHEMGFQYLDLADNHDGGSLGGTYRFTPTVSLDSRPGELKQLASEYGLTIASICAHAKLLDPPAPDRYSTHQIIKALRLAHAMGIRQVITTEGEASTEFGSRLTRHEMIFAICEKLYEPIQWARDLGIELLIEPFGRLTDTVDGMADLLEALDADDVLGINLDTGNCWLGGGDPLEFVKVFGTRIRHVHWKDMPAEWAPRRGREFGCGVGIIPLGNGVVGIEKIVKALQACGFDGPTTLELAGKENLQLSAKRLRQWSCKIV
jgi:inosose dehydratase